MEGSPGEVTSGPRRRKTVLVAFSLLLAFGIGFFLSASGFSTPSFLKDSTALVSQTLKDVLGLGSNKERTFEVDLSSSSKEMTLSLGNTALGNKMNSTIQGSSAPTSQADNKKLSGNDSTSTKTEIESSVSLNKDQFTSSTPLESSKIDSASAPDCSFSPTHSVVGTPTSDISRQNVGASDSPPSRQIIFNEIAWMGSPQRNGETASAASNNEWMELKNISQANVDLSGWQILDESEKFNIIFDRGKVSPNSLFLLERSDDDSVPEITADKIYSGALSNSGMWLKIINANCNVVDEINATSGWPGGDNSAKKTLERDVNILNWHTSANAGGTPKKENSSPVLVVQNLSQNSTAKYTAGVSTEGDGSGVVQSSPSGISCGIDCSEEYVSGTEVVLTALPYTHSSFIGWSGICSGKSDCKFVVTSTISAIAVFKSLLPPPSPSNGPTPESALSPPSSSPPTSPLSTLDHIVISALQTTGGAGFTTNDFIKIFNPLSTPFNLKGYRLVKRAKTSTSDTSLKSWTADAFIPAGGYYLWANSSFTAISETPDATTTGSIADDNGVAIRFGADDTGTIIDSVAWGAAANAFVESAPSPVNPTANQILKRKFAAGVVQDTGDNSQDFSIQ